MPVASPNRLSSLSGSGSYRSIHTSTITSSALDRPCYNSSTGAYSSRNSITSILNRTSTSSDNKRYTRHSSLAEDNGYSTSASRRENSLSRNDYDMKSLRGGDASSSSVNLLLTGRRYSGIALANSCDDIRQKYSPSNYKPNIRKPTDSSSDFISRSKSISSDIGRPPLDSKITSSRFSNKVTLATNSSNNGLGVTCLSTSAASKVSANTNNANVLRRKKDFEKSVKVSSQSCDNASNGIAKVRVNGTWVNGKDAENEEDELEDKEANLKNADSDDDNGNVTIPSVSEIRKKFDGATTNLGGGNKLTSVIPPFMKNSRKYEITPVASNQLLSSNGDKTSELSVSCQNLKLSSSSNKNSPNNGNNVRWTFFSSGSDPSCDNGHHDVAKNSLNRNLVNGVASKTSGNSSVVASISSGENHTNADPVGKSNTSSKAPSGSPSVSVLPSGSSVTSSTNTASKLQQLNNHTTDFASYIPVGYVDPEPIGDATQAASAGDSGAVETAPIATTPSRDSPVGDTETMSRRQSTGAAPPSGFGTTDPRLIRSISPARNDISTSPRLNRPTLTTNGAASIRDSVERISSNRSSLERDQRLNRDDRSYGGTAAATAHSIRNLGLNGLRNIGNTCFMNSVIQCLSNTRLLLEYLKNNSHLNDINNTTSSMKGALVKAFSTVIQELWGSESDKIVNTSALKSQIQKFAPRFMGYAQQDAQEFLRYLLEGLHEDVNRVRTRPAPILTEIDDKLSDSQKAAEAWSRYLRIDDSAIVDIFVGQLKSTLRCTVCDHASVTFDPFWDLSLPLAASSITQCLEHFTREETLDGHEKPTCAKCQQRRKCTKSFSIQKFPKILVLHLKRFSPNERFRGKLTTVVDFPLQGLDLSAFAANKGTSSVYNLYAISNHSGTTYSGHYTAYCKHPYSNEWHEYNDSRVSSISAKNVVSSEAYVLFYELSGHSSHL